MRGHMVLLSSVGVWGVMRRGGNPAAAVGPLVLWVMLVVVGALGVLGVLRVLSVLGVHLVVGWLVMRVHLLVMRVDLVIPYTERLDRRL